MIPTVIGIVMGFKVINRSEFEGVDHGRAWGVAAVSVGFAHIGLVIASVLFYFGTDADAFDAEQYVTPPTNADPTIRQLVELKRRDCFNDAGFAGGTQVGVLHVSDCDDAHDAEVIEIVPIASLDYPGQAAIDRQAADCRAAFGDYVGLPLSKSSLTFTYYYPLRASWTDPATHAITCVAVDPAGKLTDSVWQSER
ncbi:hypothetical protein F0U44_09305 [Nocardioides humilatus]|uniref:Septum formation-related domain-containing protein n=1 Tax=Nocardioides humilatus TaxID=2607660 RepID=A0A5B1LD69_9ACTN|nr:hypothetical protein [Nocardioides humilatus]KAA1418683.1 hypothetical protein F0U44_09305 [Nocardioides humilatus]